jgi:hypothetical protein
MSEIILLKPSLGHSPGESVAVVEECTFCLYYYDSFGRWCYVDKVDEGDEFVYVEDATLGAMPDV